MKSPPSHRHLPRGKDNEEVSRFRGKELQPQHDATLDGAAESAVGAVQDIPGPAGMRCERDRNNRGVVLGLREINITASTHDK
jgi:hypothetical protein